MAAEKCICNINGHPLKDSYAREQIEELKNAGGSGGSSSFVLSFTANGTTTNDLGLSGRENGYYNIKIMGTMPFSVTIGTTKIADIFEFECIILKTGEMSDSIYSCVGSYHTITVGTAFGSNKILGTFSLPATFTSIGGNDTFTVFGTKIG